ncbi:MAG: class I SAM-dependent methyltransferase [Candidatus Baltobacteraceae bacterium]
MTAKSAFLDPAIQAYVNETTVREHPVLTQLREETARKPHSRMAIGPDQGRLMQLLAHAIGARRYLEVGVFTGYSSLAMALALPTDGRIVACDVSEEWTSVARRYWDAAGVSEKIDLRIAPALETIDKLIAEKVLPFDMAFIDADKANVLEYYERCLALIRPGGMVLVDNVLWDGAVIDKSIDDAETRAIRRLNERAASDDRVYSALVTICDGLLIALKK